MSDSSRDRQSKIHMPTLLRPIGHEYFCNDFRELSSCSPVKLEYLVGRTITGIGLQLENAPLLCRICRKPTTLVFTPVSGDSISPMLERADESHSLPFPTPTFELMSNLSLSQSSHKRTDISFWVPHVGEIEDRTVPQAPSSRRNRSTRYPTLPRRAPRVSTARFRSLSLSSPSSSVRCL